MSSITSKNWSFLSGSIENLPLSVSPSLRNREMQVTVETFASFLTSQSFKIQRWEEDSSWC